ncbi:esterase-like activity of phytase family protein [Leptolyngbya sp. FACHB-261]|uniref:esterase-like activity of phytase family protein n=1 Tax=Leptolyngbya sp. FACHB-261 TaxID=2692806 RepID=UPI0016896322|nr:esterase-like activity of phytase family protein [Leptolyngbya sp. FACHB-261]MBD2105032.1 esterase-like activity of phytase family protein [Leptolyngbya sp. FACHB-261]
MCWLFHFYYEVVVPSSWNGLATEVARTLNLVRVLRTVVLMMSLIALLGACSLPQVSAESRIFGSLTLEPLGEYVIPADAAFQQTSVTGLKGLAYNRAQDRFYAVATGQGVSNPPRVYRLALDLAPEGIGGLTVEDVTLLEGPTGELYTPEALEPGGLALTPQQKLVVSGRGELPSVQVFEQSGRFQEGLPLPERYRRDGEKGVQASQGLATLTISSDGERLFTATAAPLLQDGDVGNRLLHYLIGDVKPLLISEHVYPLEGIQAGAELAELLCLDTPGTFLALERDGQGGSRLYQISSAGATDTSNLVGLQNVTEIAPLKKRLLAQLDTDLSTMSLGPSLPGGGRALVLLSSEIDQPGQLSLFRLTASRA